MFSFQSNLLLWSHIIAFTTEFFLPLFIRLFSFSLLYFALFLFVPILQMFTCSRHSWNRSRSAILSFLAFNSTQKKWKAVNVVWMRYDAWYFIWLYVQWKSSTRLYHHNVNRRSRCTCIFSGKHFRRHRRKKYDTTTICDIVYCMCLWCIHLHVILVCIKHFPLFDDGLSFAS